MNDTDILSDKTGESLTIGVFGGSFNPIHLGHTLVAVTTQQTKDYVDQVVLVPVYKHAVKRDLLPFEDRVRMCELAVEHFADIHVSTIEKQVGASNGAMLKGLKELYPKGTKFIWICGDDFFQWMHKPKGLETLREVDGLIVQRRLHKQEDEVGGQNQGSAQKHHFYKDAIDENRVKQIALQMNLEIDYIYGELPHFSSTLVRRAPGHWKSFLTTAVAKYLNEKPHLLQQLITNLQVDAEREQAAAAAEQRSIHEIGVESKNDRQRTDNATERERQETLRPPTKKHKRVPSLVEGHGLSASVVLRGLEAVHFLQKERGVSALYLSMGKEHEATLQAARDNTNLIVKEIMDARESVQQTESKDFDEVRSLAAELERIPLWLEFDRQVLNKHFESTIYGNDTDAAVESKVDDWLARLDLVEKFDPRIDVLIGATVRALTEILRLSQSRRQRSNPDATKNGTEKTTTATAFNRDIPELFQKWLEGKEALGRERAFVCSAGPTVPLLVRSSLKLRERTLLTIDTKERKIARVLSLQAGIGQAITTAPEALHKLLKQLTCLEYAVLGGFAASTPVSLVHSLLASGAADMPFDVVQFFQASTAAIDFLLSFAKALAASALASS